MGPVETVRVRFGSPPRFGDWIDSRLETVRVRFGSPPSRFGSVRFLISIGSFRFVSSALRFCDGSVRNRFGLVGSGRFGVLPVIATFTVFTVLWTFSLRAPGVPRGGKALLVPEELLEKVYTILGGFP